MPFVNYDERHSCNMKRLLNSDSILQHTTRNK